MTKKLLIPIWFFISVCYVSAADIQTVSPESQGYSSSRLERMHSGIQSFMDEGLHAGAITLIARNGEVVDVHTYGYSDIASKTPMQEDAIFRIYSMTKAITTVCVMQLYEQGKLDLSDPVTKFIPEMDQMKVLAGGTFENPVLEAANHPITIRELLTHTSGLAYSFTAEANLAKFYKGNPCLIQDCSDAFINEMVQKPLAFQPGTQFCYGISIDVLGVVVERITGQSLGEYMQENIFDALEMEDTFFSVPEEKQQRLVSLYTDGEDGLKLFFKPGAKQNTGAPICAFNSGGGGLYSTIHDYYKFAQMLLNKGQFNGHYLLSPRTVELMTVNHLTHIGDGTHIWSDCRGFGLGFEVRTKYAEGAALGSIGEYGWTGAGTTYFKIDPVQKTVELIFLQHMPHDPHGIFQKFHTLHYQSMVK